ncbi:transglutaminase domain-containing protein [bacterium]|nr:transglutaminase domain-containing protein [bacterium]
MLFFLLCNWAFTSYGKEGTLKFRMENIQIPARKTVVFRIAKGKISLIENPVKLTKLGERAISVVPNWLKKDLVDNLSRLEPSLQDRYAGLILNCPDRKYLDEIAFSIAHISSEVLRNPSFDSSLIVENVREIYEADKILEYVELVEKEGYTTAKYRLKVEGKPIEYELPRDYYYWFVVHPQFFLEMPRRIKGYFWREYFLNKAEEGYPKLRDLLKGVKFLWDKKQLGIQKSQLENNEGILSYALSRIGLWVMKQLPNGVPSRRRSLQPIEVLDGHRGSCTENQTVLAAALRSALIPSAYARNFSEDHEWVEFFMLGKWHPIQTDKGGASLEIDLPAGISYDKDYGASKELSSVSLVRGDGYIIERVAGHSKTIEVRLKVVDSKVKPIDDALVSAFTPFYPNTSGECNALATFGYTDIKGECRLTLGQNRDYLIIAEVGGEKSEGFSIEKGEEGRIYERTLVLPMEKESLKEFVFPLAQKKKSSTLSISFKIENIIYGENILWDFRRPEVRPFFSQRSEGGEAIMFLCDKDNYEKVKKREKFSAEIYPLKGNGRINIPYEKGKESYLIIYNDYWRTKLIVDLDIKEANGLKDEEFALKPRIK